MDNFILEYQKLDDDQILRIAADRDNLLLEAQLAIDAELRRRGLTQASITEYQTHVAQAQAESEVASLFFIFPWGIGKRFWGKKRRIADPGTRVEEFDSTVWLVMFWIPLFPAGTYRIRRQRGRHWRTLLFGKFSWQFHPFQVVHKRERDWQQIFSTWLWFWGIVILLFVGFTFLLSH